MIFAIILFTQYSVLCLVQCFVISCEWRVVGTSPYGQVMSY
jgi:hypothetical protein